MAVANHLALGLERATSIGYTLVAGTGRCELGMEREVVLGFVA